MRTLLPVLLLPFLAGCPWIGPTLEASRMDPDGDGVWWPDDCDDADPKVNDPIPFYADTDEDGYGDPASEKKDCLPPPGFVENSDDCDDTDAAIGPPRLFERDLDEDGWGVPDETTTDCYAPDDTWVLSGEAPDCLDSEPAVNPGLTETCNDGLDNDCDETLNDCLFLGDYALLDPLPQGSRRYTGEGYSHLGAAGAIGDATGDGIPDLVVGADQKSGLISIYGVVYVIPGPFSPGDPLTASAEASRVLVGNSNSRGVGHDVLLPGDTNGTGPTVVVSAPWGSSSGGYPGGAVFVYADSASDAPTTTIEGTGLYQSVGEGLVSLGDVNSDGHADFAFAVTATPNDGIYFVHGPVQGGVYPHGQYPYAASVSQRSYSSRVGQAMAAGDTDGDGVAELFMADPERSGGTVWTVGADLTGAAVLEDLDGANLPDWDGVNNYTWFGGSLASVGDVTGNGYGDLLVGVSGDDDDTRNAPGSVFLFAGGPDGALADMSPQKLWGEVDYGSFGSEVAGVGDVDQDGYADVLVSWQGASYGGSGVQAGFVLVYGGPAGTFGDRQASFTGVNSYNSGAFIGGGTDLNGDGVPDLVMSDIDVELDPTGYTNIVFGLGL